ncbi:MAG: OmpA family protein [Candidatus Hydrogenedentota bacterium]
MQKSKLKMRNPILKHSKLTPLFFYFLLLSCAQSNRYIKPEINQNFAINEDVSNINSVAVMPFKYPQNNPGIGKIATDELIIQLMKMEQFNIKSSEIPLADIDGIFIGEVFKCNLYDGRNPVQIGINIKLIENETGKTIWSASDIFYGDEEGVLMLVPPDLREKIYKDEKMLCRVLVRELSKSLSFVTNLPEKQAIIPTESRKQEQIVEGKRIDIIEKETKKEEVKEVVKEETTAEIVIREEIKVPKKPTTIEFQDYVLFDKNKIEIKKDALKNLDNLVEILKKFPDVLVLIEGHTSDMDIIKKSFSSNWELSFKRAESVAKYLIQKGVNNDKLFIIGWADSFARVKNTSEKNRSLNRRVEIYVIPDKYQFNKDTLELYRLMADYLCFVSKEKAVELGKEVLKIHRESDIAKFIEKRLQVLEIVK